MEKTDCLKHTVLVYTDLIMIILKVGILTKRLIEAFEHFFL